MIRWLRRSRLEKLEPRVVFNADPVASKPLWVGGVYIEEDSGSDAHGDSFYVTFEGGVANTKLTKLVINTDQNTPGYSVADNLFDTLDSGRGADHSFGFKVESLEAKDPSARVWADVLDGSMQLVLNFENFYAGDRLVFSIDVDEVQHLYSTVDIQEFNEGLDPITSGAEFEGSMFRAEFSAPHYENATASGRFFNRYDAQLDQAKQAGSELGLPADNADGKRDRSSGVAATTPQILIPSSIAGKVYLDNNDNGQQDPTESGLGGVTIELVSSQTITGEKIRRTVTTQSDGTYRFDSIPPGLYELFEVQPVGLFDGQDSVGRVGNEIRGSLIANDRIGNILLNGGDVGIEYNFGELQPSTISGNVHIGLPGFACFSTDPRGSKPLADVTITLVDNLGKVVATTQTDATGAYRFNGLPKGLYTVIESQPVGLIDGSSKAGLVDGVTNGQAISGTRIESIRLLGGQTAIEYDFCERLPSSIAGNVYEDLDENGSYSPNEDPIPGVLIELIDSDGTVIASTTTISDGSYRFEGLAPGTYTIRQRQPAGYFQGGQRSGSAGGNALSTDTISSIVLPDGLDAIGYDFMEIPPGVLSGYVFQDGDELLTSDGQPPSDLTGIREGIRTADDRPIAGSKLILRKLDGSLLSAQDVLPGHSINGLVEVITDASGFYRFDGIRPGKYHIYQVSSASGLSDGWDTPGTTGGVAINAGQSIPADIQDAIDMLANEQGADPGRDALLFVQVIARGVSLENNFSEILVGVLPPPPPPPPPPPRPVQPVPPIDPGPLVPGPMRAEVYRFPSNPPWVVLAPLEELRLPQSIAGFNVDYTWHLSVINAGEPRGYQDRKTVDREQIAKAAKMLNATTWTVDAMDSGRWQIVASMKKPIRIASKRAFRVQGATQLAGDFNGDGQDELALFKDGEWLIDINGNGQWDRTDLWAQLGGVGDLPVVGDWDGDGKDDIGVWGIARDGDGAAIEREPGLPDPENRLDTRPKNLPPNQDEESLVRLLQRGSQGDPRSDVIDHVFRFGARGDQPIAGDFNGDGVSTLGIFKDGNWVLDVNGDGQLDPVRDGYAQFGKTGDIAIVGDFNGDGIDEIAVVRGDQVIVDSNSNGRLDATDRVFEIQGEGENVVVGDFDGDGIDEAAYYSAQSGSESAQEGDQATDGDEGFRQARSK